MFLTAEITAYSIGIVTFLLMPLLLSPIFYLVQLYVKYKVEKQHDKSSLEISFEPFKAYSIFKL